MYSNLVKEKNQPCNKPCSFEYCNQHLKLLEKEKIQTIILNAVKLLQNLVKIVLEKQIQNIANNMKKFIKLLLFNF